MKHAVYGRKLGRKTAHRKAMFRNMAVSLFTHGQITTTLPKAKAVKPFIEKLITAAKTNDLSSRRQVISMLGGEKWIIENDLDTNVDRNKYGELRSAPKASDKLFNEIAPKYVERPGGYTRIIKLSRRRFGDGTALCVLQLVEDGQKTKPASASLRRKKAEKRAAFANQAIKPAAEAPATEAPATEEAASEQAASE